MRRHWRVLAAAVLAMTALAAYGGDLTHLQGLVDSGNAQAYPLARTLSANYAGNPDFDYLYGRAALASGHVNQAIFALQRVMIDRPTDDRARLLLAQAYLRNGERVLAQRELDIVLAHNSPAVTRQATELRASLDGAQRSVRNHSYVELGLGYDSNVNAAPSASLIALPPGTAQPLSGGGVYYPANLVVSPGYQSQSDGFWRFAFGLNTYRPFATRGYLFGSVDGDENADFSKSAFDTTVANVIGGAGIQLGSNYLSLPLYHQEFLIGHRRYRQHDAFGLEWTYRADPANVISLVGQYGNYVYQDESVQNTDSGVAALTWARNFAVPSQPRIKASIYRGRDAAKDELYDYFGRSYYGISAEGSFAVSPRQRPYATLLYQRSNYDAADPGFPVIRVEHYSRVAAGWMWQMKPKWILRAEVSYADNHSNIDIYQYHRTLFYLSTRHDFY